MKVGDYVRTDTGKIGKITYFEGDIVRVDCDKFITYKSNHNEIVKSSPNIIDLIKVGDYVNGERVIYKQYKEYPNPLLDHYVVDTIRCSYREEDIKSIVTREMFESMEYKVGE